MVEYVCKQKQYCKAERQEVKIMTMEEKIARISDNEYAVAMADRLLATLPADNFGQRFNQLTDLVYNTFFGTEVEKR